MMQFATAEGNGKQLKETTRKTPVEVDLTSKIVQLLNYRARIRKIQCHKVGHTMPLKTKANSEF